MIDLKALPPNLETTLRKFEQQLREENERRARVLNEQHQRLLEGISARYTDVNAFKPPSEMPSVLSPEELEQTMKMLRDVERALENLSPELQDAFWNLPLDDGFFDASSIVLNPHLTDKQRAAELATFLAGGEVESSWLQLRRALYPIAGKVFVGIDVAAHINTAFFGSETFQKYVSIIALSLLVIYFLGDPEDENATRKNR